ncbi:MAG: AAA family ATPase, partial [Leptospiraceae bacterium]|nr:AAA family ATPase [Leptospiraceae bacterium]
MLLRLRIKDFALIENLDLDFSKSLNAIIGESGSGKTLIFDALAVILGGKCNVFNIRAGAKKYQIEATFDISKLPKVSEWLVSKSIPLESSSLFLRKELYTDGKSRVQINSALVPHTYLKDVGSLLAEFHRQNEQFYIFEREKQLEILDLFAELEQEKKEFKKTFHSYRNLKAQIQQLESNEHEKQRRKEIYKYQIEEIQKANLSPEEETNLLQEEKILSQSEKIAEHISFALNYLEGEERELLPALIKAHSSLEKISSIREEFSQISQEIMNAYYNLKEIISNLHEELEETDFSFERLERVQKRLDEIQRLKKKYARSVPEILNYKIQLERDLENLEHGDSLLFNLQSELEKQRTELTQKAIQLSLKRRKAISEIEAILQSELEELGMKDSRIQVILRWESSPDGDVIEAGKKYFVNETG